MLSSNQSSDALDPLHGLSILSLFPRTFGPSTTVPNLQDLSSVHDFMLSLGLRRADKLVEQAKVIVDNGSKFLNSNFANFGASMRSNDADVAKADEKPKERRAGLSLERARFSVKPDSRLSVEHRRLPRGAGFCKEQQTTLTSFESEEQNTSAAADCVELQSTVAVVKSKEMTIAAETFGQKLNNELDISGKLKPFERDGVTPFKSKNFISGDVVTERSDHALNKSMNDYCSRQSDTSVDLNDPNGSSLTKDKNVDISAQELTTELIRNNAHPVLDATNASLDDGCTSDELLSASEFGQEQKTKCPRKSCSKQNKENKPLQKGRKGKALSLTQSLADAGSSWENGVRRSTRKRFRPLEYWKGERFLYGRVHGSLATVVGIKYLSPAHDDRKPVLKVKSYVSSDYKDLVELAALY